MVPVCEAISSLRLLWEHMAGSVQELLHLNAAVNMKPRQPPQLLRTRSSSFVRFRSDQLHAIHHHTWVHSHQSATNPSISPIKSQHLQKLVHLSDGRMCLQQ